MRHSKDGKQRAEAPGRRTPRVRCYIDGLNLYYGVARPYGCKWVDLQALLRALLRRKLPGAEVERLVLFSAPMVERDAAARQKTYFKALRQHSPNLELVLGHFRSFTKFGKLLDGQDAGEVRKVATREEKRTDVNLACRMVDDAHTAAGKEFDVACLVSNDADLAAALGVKERLGQKTMLITPRTTHEPSLPAADLRRFVHRGDITYTIEEDLVRRCRLPERVGRWRCPDAPGWGP